LKPDTTDKVIFAACSPNTYLSPRAVDREDFNTGSIIPGEWWENVDTLQSVNSLGSHNYKRAAEEVRTSYARYFAEENPLQCFHAYGIPCTESNIYLLKNIKL
jgi:hypothetical protein